MELHEGIQMVKRKAKNNSGLVEITGGVFGYKQTCKLLVRILKISQYKGKVGVGTVVSHYI